MNALSRYCAIAIAATCLTFSSSLLAKDPAKTKELPECCKATQESVKKGEACDKCVEHPCCKKTAKVAEKAAEKAKEAKPCEKCAKKEDKPAS